MEGAPIYRVNHQIVGELLLTFLPSAKPYGQYVPQTVQTAMLVYMPTARFRRIASVVAVVGKR